LAALLTAWDVSQDELRSFLIVRSIIFIGSIAFCVNFYSYFPLPRPK